MCLDRVGRKREWGKKKQPKWGGGVGVRVMANDKMASQSRPSTAKHKVRKGSGGLKVLNKKSEEKKKRGQSHISRAAQAKNETKRW